MIKLNILFNDSATAYKDFIAIKTLLEKTFHLTQKQKMLLIAFAWQWIIHSWKAPGSYLFSRKEFKELTKKQLATVTKERNKMPTKKHACLLLVADSEDLSIEAQDYIHWSSQDGRKVGVKKLSSSDYDTIACMLVDMQYLYKAA